MALTFVAVSRQLLAFFMILLVLTQEMLAMPLVTRPSTDVDVGGQIDSTLMGKGQAVRLQSSSESQVKVEEESVEMDKIQGGEIKQAGRSKRNVVLPCQMLDNEESCSQLVGCEWSVMSENCNQAYPVLETVILVEV